MAADFNKPAVADNYSSAYTPYLVDNFVAVCRGLDPATATYSNPPTNAVRWNSANTFWEKYNGSTWAALSSSYNITVSKASHIVGGAQGSLPYQTAADTTALLAKGTAGQVLAMNGGATAPSWVAQSAIVAGDSAKLNNVAASSYLTIGKQSIWIPAGAMIPRISNGPAVGLVETTVNKVMLSTLDFDATAAEFAQFTVTMPKSWDAGTVTFKAMFSHASGSGNVIFSLAGVSFANDDALDFAFGTAVAPAATTVGTANDLYMSAESGNVTISGAGKGEFVTFQVARDVTDTLGVDARLHGIQIFFTTDAATDA